MKKISETKTLKKTNEGAGAGYDVEVKGLEVQDVTFSESENGMVEFTATLKPGTVYCTAYDYYGYGFPAHDYDEPEVEIKGGKVQGVVALEDWRKDSNQSIVEVMDDLEADVTAILKSDFSEFKSMVGAGWTHSNLNDVQYYDVEMYFGDYDQIGVTSVTLDSPDMAQAVNYAFAHGSDDDEEEEGDEEEINETSFHDPAEEGYEDEDELKILNEIAEEEYPSVKAAYNTLKRLQDRIDKYDPTCQYQLDEAIRNAEEVLEWVRIGAKEGFSD